MPRPNSISAGQQYGHWTVLEDAGWIGSNHCYQCRCECGKEKIVAGTSLRSGKSQSCGCRRDNHRLNGIDLTGQTIGLWQVLAPAARNAQGRKQYLCRCACGNERIVLESALLNGTSKSCGCWRKKDEKTDVDLTGQTFGYWTVLGPAEKADQGSEYFHCRCICGQERDIPENTLRSGQSKSCGCRNKHVEDLTGQQFGYWTVLERAEPGPRGETRYLCRCRCGTEKIVPASNLRRGISRSCGCLRAELKTTTGDLVGRKFGSWTVIAPADPYINRTKRYLCRCRCGTEKIIVATTLTHGLTKSCGCRGKDRTQPKNQKQKKNS